MKDQVRNPAQPVPPPPPPPPPCDDTSKGHMADKEKPAPAPDYPLGPVLRTTPGWWVSGAFAPQRSFRPRRSRRLRSLSPRRNSQSRGHSGSRPRSLGRRLIPRSRSGERIPDPYQVATRAYRVFPTSNYGFPYRVERAHSLPPEELQIARIAQRKRSCLLREREKTTRRSQSLPPFID